MRVKRTATRPRPFTRPGRIPPPTYPDATPPSRRTVRPPTTTGLRSVADTGASTRESEPNPRVRRRRRTVPAGTVISRVTRAVAARTAVTGAALSTATFVTRMAPVRIAARVMTLVMLCLRTTDPARHVPATRNVGPLPERTEAQ